MHHPDSRIQAIYTRKQNKNTEQESHFLQCKSALSGLQTHMSVSQNLVGCLSGQHFRPSCGQTTDIYGKHIFQHMLTDYFVFERN